MDLRLILGWPKVSDAKSAKNRLHLDLSTTSLDHDVAGVTLLQRR
ncbi:MAG: hypothetical protein ACRDZN_02910 [Acidimicrobiales bacterium]